MYVINIKIMKNGNEPIKKGKLVLSFGLAVSVKSVADVTEKIAENLITRVECSDKKGISVFLF